MLYKCYTALQQVPTGRVPLSQTLHGSIIVSIVSGRVNEIYITVIYLAITLQRDINCVKLYGGTLYISLVHL